ncbi:MAG: dockerin type I repeat-containing protein, partial [Oscillospiraceae bacterium]
FGMLGDLNGDNAVTSLDALMVLQATTEMISLDYNQMKSADVSGDGKITSLDALIILQYTTGIISEF